jgi:hypothetical protein
VWLKRLLNVHVLVVSPGRIMRRTFALTALCLPITACAPPINSVDGLEGGELASDIVVPKLTANFVAASEANLGEVDAINVDADAVTTAVLDADALKYRGMVVYGSPVGKVAFGGNGEALGYRSADDQCRGQFGETARVCGADEAMMAWRSGVEIDSVLSGAAVNTFGMHTTVQFEVSDYFRSIVVSDCNGWSSRSPYFTESTIVGPDEELAEPFEHSYMSMVFIVGAGWRLSPNLTSMENCSSVELLCCS